MVQAEFLEARRIDDAAAAIEVVEPREGGGVLAGIERGGNFARGDVGIGHQQVDQGRFAHAGLADQDARLPGKQRRQQCTCGIGRGLD